MKYSTVLLSVGAAILLGGCAVGAKPIESPAPAAVSPITLKAPMELIATDFVNALSQLAVVPPASTTVSLHRNATNDPFTRSMLYALQRAGYATRWVELEGSGSLFQYRHSEELTSQNVSSSTYELAVGAVEMRRSYSLAGEVVQPLSPLYVRGTDARGIELNDDIFTRQAQFVANRANRQTQQSKLNASMQSSADKVNAVPAQPVARSQQNTAPTLALQYSSNLQVPEEANPLNPIIGRAATSQRASTRALALPLIATQKEENVFALGASNFEDVLAGHRVVTEQILTFANDSMRLGDLNKRLVEQLVEQFNASTDVFSVIGCSMGPTAVRGGNAALALGRAGRVVEALRFAGVDDGHILDEGCWAGDGSIDSLPKRGVVLTLNRQV